MGSASFKREKIFIKEFFLLLEEVFETAGNNNLVKFLESGPTPISFNELGRWLSELIAK